MAEQQVDPENPDVDAGEGGFGPGEKGESIEEGRENAKREDDGDEDSGNS
jgi:hypothetical protein